MRFERLVGSRAARYQQSIYRCTARLHRHGDAERRILSRLGGDGRRPTRRGLRGLRSDPRRGGSSRPPSYRSAVPAEIGLHWCGYDVAGFAWRVLHRKARPPLTTAGAGYSQGIAGATIVTKSPTTKLETHLASSLMSTFSSTNRHTPPAMAPTTSLYTMVQNEPSLRLLVISATTNATPIKIIFDVSKTLFPSTPSLTPGLTESNIVDG